MRRSRGGVHGTSRSFRSWFNDRTSGTPPGATPIMVVHCLSLDGSPRYASLALFCSDRQSFVQWDMRRAAMKLHTRDQAPREGKQETKGVPFSDWKPSR